jgi:hypothetical protein
MNQRGRKLGQRDQWIGKQVQGFKRGKRRKFCQLIVRAGKLVKMRREIWKPCNVIVVKA